MSDQYYIRVRGEVKGPLTQDQIVAQIRRKRLGRHHELSVDAVTWQKAGDMAEFFQPAVTKRERQPVAETEAEPTPSADVAELASGQSASGSSAEEWYYSKGGNRLGPVSASDIQMWLSSGKLAADDLVWNEEFDNWIPAGDLPQFAFAGDSAAAKKKKTKVSDMQAAGFWEVFMGTSPAARLPDDAIHKFPNLTRYLRIAESSLRILFVLALFLTFASMMYVVGRAVYEEQWPIVAAYLIGAPIQVIFLWLLFITGMAGLELVRVVIQIEDNTSA